MPLSSSAATNSHRVNCTTSPTQAMAVISSALLLAAIISFLALMLVTVSKNKKKNSLPSPRGLPIIGNLHQLGLRPHRALQALAARHGPLMLIHLGSKPVLVVSSASAARTVLRTHDLTFSSRPPIAAADRLLYGGRDLGFSPYGEYWRQARRLCVLHLLSARRVRSFRTIREQEVASLVERLKQQAESSGLEPAAVEVNLSKAVAELTNDITCRIALGKKYKHQDPSTPGRAKSDGVRELLEELLVLLGSFNVADYIPWLGWLNKINGLDARMNKSAADIDRVLGRVLDDHLVARDKGNCGAAGREDDCARDFVDVMLSLQEEGQGENGVTGSDGMSWDHQSIKAIILDMFVAGTHTTYTTIDWAMAELMMHKEVMEKLQHEVRQIGMEKTMLDEDDIKNMNYLSNFIKEILRLHPPAPLLVPRQSIEDIELDGHHIPKGISVYINAWAIARDPNVWDRPGEFWPERFNKEGMNVDFYGTDFQLIPFGSGRRGCPGIQFAVPVIELVIANLLYKFDWKFPNSNKGLLDMMEISVGLTAQRQSSLILVAKPR